MQRGGMFRAHTPRFIKLFNVISNLLYTINILFLFINTLQIYNILYNTQNIYYFCLKIFYMSLLKVVLHPDKIVKYGLNIKQAVVLDLILKQCDRKKAENIMGLTFFKISNDKLLEDTEFLNIKKRMLIIIINELEKLDLIKKPRNQNRRMLLRFTNKAVEYFKS